MRILLIEDTADVRMMLAAWLEDEGHDVIEADSLASAMAAFQPPHRYEAVIADVLLPDGSGQDLAELARQAGVPVLLCTGDINTLNSLQNQGFRCLSKPFRFEALAAWLADMSLDSVSSA
jgi:DNA-binding response OmpR family regulator